MNKIEPWQVIIFFGLTAFLYGFAQDLIDWMGWIEPPVVGDKFGALARAFQRFISSVILSSVAAGAMYAFFSWLASIPADDPRSLK
ncbi:hypothetical protein [Pseudomonas syringae]|uniref:hypothetical protein n=1 Tax=Pseudomonas syringae TaxID=317 RepID=UPI0009458CA3|nr:hypothetical protein [Pseudomonas syringae]MCK0551026.1 hypothetical protein [Pseudomonas syringae pv. aptata]